MQDVTGTASNITNALQDTPALRPPSRPAATGRKNRRELPESLKKDELISVDQLAALIGVDKRTIFRWKAAGYLPPYDFEFGQTRRWKLSTVRTVIEQPQRLRRAAV